MQQEKTESLLARFETLHPKIIDLSLGRIERLLGALGNPHRRLPPVIHVAGTNGKGSAVAFLKAMLEAAGYRTHAFISPHLRRFHERIMLAGPGGARHIGERHLVDVLSRAEFRECRPADHLLRDYDGGGFPGVRREPGRCCAA